MGSSPLFGPPILGEFKPFLKRELWGLNEVPLPNFSPKKQFSHNLYKTLKRVISSFFPQQIFIFPRELNTRLLLRGPTVLGGPQSLDLPGIGPGLSLCLRKGAHLPFLFKHHNSPIWRASHTPFFVAPPQYFWCLITPPHIGGFITPGSSGAHWL